MANMMPYFDQSMNQTFFRQPCGCAGSGVSPYANSYANPYANQNPYGTPMPAANAQMNPYANMSPVAGMSTGGKTSVGPEAKGKTGALGSNSGAGTETGKSPKVLYKANKESVGHVKKMKEEASICNQYVNHYVRVETIDGQTHEGYLVGLQNDTVYLAAQQAMRAPYPYYSPYPAYNPYGAVLPLVLFNLLAISLI